MTSTDPVTPAPVPGPGPVAAAGPSAGPTPAASAAPTAGASSSAGASAAPIPGKDTSLVTEETDKLEFRDPEQPNLHVVYWTRPGATPPSHGARILLWNHGICEHSGRYRGIAAEVLARVAALDAVAAYDMRGHGMSAGPRGKIASELDLEADLAQHVLPAVAMRFGEAPSIVLAGHSLGGLVVAGVTSGPDPLVANEMGALAGVVLSAPAIEVIVPGIVNKMLAPLAGIVNRIPGARCMTKPAGIPPAHLSHCEEEVKAFVDDPKTYALRFHASLIILFRALSASNFFLFCLARAFFVLAVLIP